jgi:TolC family type I secretion outer membrane protein
MNKALGLLLIAVAAGCVNQAREVATYRKQLDALPGATLPVPADYTPLSLQQAMLLAERNDESLGLSGETYLQAMIAKDKEFSAFLPTLSLAPVFIELQRARGENGPSHSFNIPANGDINVFNGFRDQATLEQDTANIEQQRQLLLNEQQTILLDVAQMYYTVLQDERQVTVLENSLAEQDERVRQSVAKYRLGSGTPLDVAQSQSQASATRVSLVQARASVVTARATLGFLIGSPAATRPLTDGFEPPRQLDRPLEAWLAEASYTRQDLAAANAAVEAARDGVRVAIGEYLPSVTLDLTYLLYNETPPLNQRLSGGFTANIPIFTGGQIEADVRNAFSILRAAALTLSQTRKQVEEDIRTAYADVENARDQITELRVELAASRDALVLAQRQFDVGLGINLDVLTAQDQLLSTQLQLATQEYQEKIAYLNLLRVAGHLTVADAGVVAHAVIERNNPAEITTPEVIHSTTAPSR